MSGWENPLGALGSELGDERGVDPIDAALDLMLVSALDVTMFLHYADVDAVRAIAGHRLQLVRSDGIFGARPHPRPWGTSARFLGRFVLGEGVLSVEEGVARLTSRPDALFGLSDRGIVAPGLRADLVYLERGSVRGHGYLRRSVSAIRRGRRRLDRRELRPARGRADGRTAGWRGASVGGSPGDERDGGGGGVWLEEGRELDHDSSAMAKGGEE